MRKRAADQKLFEWPRPIRTKSTAQLNANTGSNNTDAIYEIMYGGTGARSD